MKDDSYRELLKLRHSLELQMLADYRRMMRLIGALKREQEEWPEMPEPEEMPETFLECLKKGEEGPWDLGKSRELFAAYAEAMADFKKCEQKLSELPTKI